MELQFTDIMELQFTDIVASLAIIISVATFFWSFSMNKKLHAETEWHRTWASDFLAQANNFNKLASQIVVGIHLWNSMKKEEKSDDAEKQNEEVTNNLNKIPLYEWELKKYSKFAPNNADHFGKSTQELYTLLGKLVAYCKDPKTDEPFDLEKIREAQFSYSEASRKLHKELLGI